jgi:hypothetical protein
MPPIFILAVELVVVWLIWWAITALVRPIPRPAYVIATVFAVLVSCYLLLHFVGAA